MIVTAAMMRYPCLIEKPVKTANSSSGRREQYEELYTTRCYYKKVSGSRVFQDGWDKSINSLDLYLYWRHTLESEISKDLRFVVENRIFRVIAFDLMDEKRMMYKVEVEEIR
jgi:head-tail adaptor